MAKRATKKGTKKTAKKRTQPGKDRPGGATSPYAGVRKDDWSQVTADLVEKHPISTDHIVEAVLESWEDIFRSKFGKQKFQIGKDIFPTPQVLGNLLHELIPLNLASQDKRWRHAASKQEKDLVFVPDPRQSIELKTSSNPGRIFGNRSYGQRQTPDDPALKGKSGFYLAVNFEKVVRDAERRATEQAKLLPIYRRG